MFRFTVFMIAVLALVAVPANAALFQEDHTDLDATDIQDAGWVATAPSGANNMKIATTHADFSGNEAIVGATATGGPWSRYSQIFSSPVTSGKVALHATVSLTSTGGNNDQFGFLNDSNTAGGPRLADFGTGIGLGGVTTGAAEFAFDGLAQLFLEVDLDTDAVTARLTPLQGQNGGAASEINATWRARLDGSSLNGLWMAVDAGGGSLMGIDNIFVDIPEPTTLGLLSLGGLLMLRRRRRLGFEIR